MIRRSYLKRIVELNGRYRGEWMNDDTIMMKRDENIIMGRDRKGAESGEKEKKAKPDDPWEGMTWKEINEGLDVMVLMERFEKLYGDAPEVTWLDVLKSTLRLPNKFERWHNGFTMFRAGAKAGRVTQWKWIMNSGWLKKVVQEEFEKQMEGDEGQIQTRKE